MSTRSRGSYLIYIWSRDCDELVLIILEKRRDCVYTPRPRNNFYLYQSSFPSLRKESPMEPRESFRDVENLRFRFQMNNRLRLECLAAVSKVFRDFNEPIADDLLATIVFALPQELVSANGNGNGHAYGSGEQQPTV